MDSKSPVAKSASNVTLIPSRRNKKSVSNEDIKKRGVYVERKVVSTLLDAKEATNVQAKRKAPPRPRPGQKKFLSSVLTILSKSTASTQYPDINDTDANKRSKLKSRRFKNDKIAAGFPKNKYKSRILNNNIRTGEEFIVLQSKKDIAQTPSNYSESANIKWSDVEPTEDKSVYNEVLEGKKFNDEMKTLAEMNKEDDNIYNLFVDLLETTFDVYNEKEYDLDNVTNTVLQINEDVAKKLEMNSATTEDLRKTNKKVKIEFDNYPEAVDIPLDIKQSNPVTRPKIKSKSFSYPKKIRTLQKSNSYNIKKSAKSKKKDLLNILKEELKMDVPVEEPQNIYEALKVIAKNKQQTEKTFIEQKTNKNNNETGRRDPECMFRRRNLFFRSKRRKREKIVESAYREVPTKYKKKIKNIPSYKSVEVYGYNYDDEPRELMQKKGVVLTYHSSPTASDLDYYTLLQFPDSSTSHFNFDL